MSSKNTTNMVVTAIVLVTLVVIVYILRAKPETPVVVETTIPEITNVTVPVDGQPATINPVAPLGVPVAIPVPAQ